MGGCPHIKRNAQVQAQAQEPARQNAKKPFFTASADTVQDVVSHTKW